ncbi:MAG: hypothetical protein RCO49_03495 [Rickettsia endosymbiont of Argas persicus]
MDLAIRKNMVDEDCSNLSIARQCTLLFINKSSYYYKPQGLTQKRLRNNASD